MQHINNTSDEETESDVRASEDPKGAFELNSRDFLKGSCRRVAIGVK